MSLNKNQDIAGANIALGNFTLSGISGAATTYTSAAVDVCIDGKVTTLAVQSGVAFPKTDLNTAATLAGLQLKSTGTILVVGILNGGTVLQCLQGSIEALDVGGNFIAGNVPKFPSLPDTFCPLAYIIVKAGATFVAATFLPGTTNWNTTGMSYAVQNIATLPDAPQVS